LAPLCHAFIEKCFAVVSRRCTGNLQLEATTLPRPRSGIASLDHTKAVTNMRIGLRRALENLLSAVEIGPRFPLRHISRLFGRKYHLTISKQAGEFYIRPETTDAQAFVHVFQHRHYNLSGHRQFPWILDAYNRIINSGQIPIIIDAGANVGAASIWFSRQFPKAHIIAVEPDPDNADMCRLNTRTVSNVSVIEAAIGSEHGRVSLANPSNEAWGIQTQRDEDGPVTIFTIPELVSTVKRPAKLFLVKVDIEGFEHDLFARNTEWLNVVDVLVVEPHDWLFPGKRTSKNFQTALAARQFELLISGENLIYVRVPEQVSPEG
jgi:FkbM family methyltransferase